MGSIHPAPTLPPKIYFGTYQLGYDDIYQALVAGYRAIDTAQTYDNEADVGRAVLAFLSSSHNKFNFGREDITVVSKLARNVEDYDAAYLAIVGSVKKLGLGYVDVFLVHTPWGGEKAARTSWRAVEEAVERGIVRYGGISNFEVPDVREFLVLPIRVATHLLSHVDRDASELEPQDLAVVNQLEVHPFNARRHIRECCSKHGIGIQAYGCLARGKRMQDPVITGLSTRYGCTPGQLMIKWSLQRGMSPITKSARPEVASENLHVNELIIHEGDMRLLDGLDEGLEVWDLDQWRY